MKANRDELLRVLDHPEVPLHTNRIENDIRDHVTRRKISFGTRSEAGRAARDAYTGGKKTCKKLGLSFWDDLRNRLGVAGRSRRAEACGPHQAARNNLTFDDRTSAPAGQSVPVDHRFNVCRKRSCRPDPIPGKLPPYYSENGSHGVGGVTHGSLGKMRVLDSGPRILVTEQASDDGNGRALHDGDTGMGVTSVMKPHVVQVRVGPYTVPETADGGLRDGYIGTGRQKDPAGRSRQSRQHGPGWG